MGVAVTVLSVLNAITPQQALPLLRLGLFPWPFTLWKIDHKRLQKSPSCTFEAEGPFVGMDL